MKFLITDQDGTLIVEAPFTSLAISYGFHEKNMRDVNRYMQRELSYEELTKVFVDELISRNAKRRDIEKILKGLTPVNGLSSLLERLNGNGLAVLSGGFIEVSEIHGILPKFKEHYGLRLLYNEGGVISGRTHFEGTSEGKLLTLQRIVTSHDLSLRDICYLGDSGNDYLVAKELVNNGGTFIMVQPEQDGDESHHYKKHEYGEIEKLCSLASKVISSLEEVIPFIE